MVSIKVNGDEQQVDMPEDTPLLWALRDELKMTGTKFGCGHGYCGACTVHVNDQPERACTKKLGACAGKSITTIEAYGADGNLHAVQRAWIEEAVSQCGYCQPGQIMSAIALLRDKPNPTDDDIDAAMEGNACRCGTYPRIRKAIKRAAQMLQGG